MISGNLLFRYISRNNYVFKGAQSSTINILLVPIYYSKKNDNIYLSGYRSTFQQYDRGGVLNALNFYSDNNGVSLQFKVRFINNIINFNLVFVWN